MFLRACLSVAGELLGMHVSLIDTGALEYSFHRRHHGRRPGDIEDRRGKITHMLCKHFSGDIAMLHSVSLRTSLLLSEGRYQLEPRVLLFKFPQLIDEGSILWLAVAVEQEQAVLQAELTLLGSECESCASTQIFG